MTTGAVTSRTENASGEVVGEAAGPSPVTTPPDDPDNHLEEFCDLWSGETAEDLHRVLVLHQSLRGVAVPAPGW